MKKNLLIFVSSLLLLSFMITKKLTINALDNSSIEGSEISYSFPNEIIDLSEVKGFKFDFNPTTTTSYNVEITDANNNIWSTNGFVNGINGDKGSGVLKSNANNTSAFYTNVFDSIAAGSYQVYIPFEFYTGKTEKNNKVINPVFKIKGYNDDLGVSIDNTTYELPTSLLSCIKFIASSDETASSLENAISNIELVDDDSIYTHLSLNLEPSVINTALDGYNELGSRQTVAFNTKTTILKWSAGTGMSSAAGFMLKMGNTGLNDIKIRFTITENGKTNPAGVDAMTESYSGKEIDENEYYQFIHGNNSIKQKGTVEKLYITSRKMLLPAGYQGLLLVPFARLRWQADGYISTDTPAYYNGRLDNQLGTIRLYVDNISEEAALENSLTFYVMNAIKAADGKGVSYKTVGASGGSSVAVDSSISNQVIISSTAPSSIDYVNDTLEKTESISISTPNSGDNASKLYMGQNAIITITNIDKNKKYVPKLYNDNKDLSKYVNLISKTDESITYSYKKSLQSHGNVTFKLFNEFTVNVKDGNSTILSDNFLSNEDYVLNKSSINKEHYNIISFKANGIELAEIDGQYVISKENGNVDVNVIYELIRHSLLINKDSNLTYEIEGSENPSYFDSIKIKLKPSTGYEIDKVLINGVENEIVNNEICLSNINEDTTVNITSCIISTKIIVNLNGNGTYQLDRNKVNVDDSIYNLTVNPDNYNIIKTVKIDDQEVTLTDNKYQGHYTGKEINVSIEFEPIIYEISTNDLKNAEVSLSNGYYIDYYSNSTMIITPNNGYEILNVKVNDSLVALDNNSYEFKNLTENQNVFIDIKPIDYNISVEIDENGTYSLDKNKVNIEDDSYTLILTPSANYEVKEILVNGDAVNITNNTYSGFNVNEDIKIKVSFTIKTYKVSFEETENGEIKVSSNKVSHGSSLKITVTPNDGYEVDYVLINGNEIELDDFEYYLTNVTEPIEICVEFIEISKQPIGCKSATSGSIFALALLGLLIERKRKK